MKKKTYHYPSQKRYPVPDFCATKAMNKVSLARSLWYRCTDETPDDLVVYKRVADRPIKGFVKQYAYAWRNRGVGVSFGTKWVPVSIFRFSNPKFRDMFLNSSDPISVGEPITRGNNEQFGEN